LYCNNNQLKSLNVSNDNNLNFIYFNATNNPDLLCVEVDDVDYSIANWSLINTQTAFSENCVDFLSIENIVIYPNPKSGFIRLSSSVNIQYVKVYDLKGSLLYEKPNKSDKIDIDISYLETGIYFIKTDSEHGKSIHKIVKQ